MTGAGVTNAPPAIARDDGWLSKSRVLRAYDGRIECIMGLPDNKTIRVVVDDPRHAEDVDIETGKSRVANLAPIAIAEGCARLSPDGKKLVYQGRDDKQRPHVMLSRNPDGAQATPVIRSAEPS